MRATISCKRNATTFFGTNCLELEWMLCCRRSENKRVKGNKKCRIVNHPSCQGEAWEKSEDAGRSVAHIGELTRRYNQQCVARVSERVPQLSAPVGVASYTARLEPFWSDSRTHETSYCCCCCCTARRYGSAVSTAVVVLQQYVSYE